MKSMDDQQSITGRGLNDDDDQQFDNEDAAIGIRIDSRRSTATRELQNLGENNDTC